jgi:hypothetical protein
MKQTAVEWFAEQMITKGRLTPELFEQAKDMEKEQMKQLMWDQTHLDEKLINKGLIVDNLFDKYWSENFNKKC